MNRQNSINYIVKKYNLDLSQEMPIRIPNTDRYSDLVELYNELGYKEGAEIGTAEGNFALFICKNNPEIKLHCIDSWVKYEGYNDFEGDYFSKAEKTARELLAPFNCNFIKKFSSEALLDIKDNSLDFVYIDANHEVRHVIDDITDWSKKIRPGGMISGHDWFISMRHPERLQVVYALEAYTKAWGIKPWFVLGRDERLPGEKRQKARSWFFFK